jgi:hypothetical protein
MKSLTDIAIREGWGANPNVVIHAYLAMLGLCTLIFPKFAEEPGSRVDMSDCLRRFRPLKGPSHFSLLAQRKVTQRKGLKGSRHGRDTSLNLSIDTESCSQRVLRPGYTARRRGTEDLKQACRPSRSALSPQRLGASRYRDKVEAGEPTLIAVPQAFRLESCAAPRALQAVSLGYFSLGQQRKVTRAPTAIESAAGNLPDPRAASFLRGITFSNYKNLGIRQGSSLNVVMHASRRRLGFAPQPTH